MDDWGSWGYVAYTFVYTALELVIIPAVPLTMASGVLFGVIPGTIVVSLASTAAAAIAFLISRYAARDKVLVASTEEGRTGFSPTSTQHPPVLLLWQRRQHVFSLTLVYAGGLGMLRCCQYNLRLPPSLFATMTLCINPQIADLAKDNKKFTAIDKAIGKDSFKVYNPCRLAG